MSWYKEATLTGDEHVDLVIEAKFGHSTPKDRKNRKGKKVKVPSETAALPRWQRDALQRATVLVSDAVPQVLQRFERALSIVMARDDGEERVLVLGEPWKPEGGRWGVKSAQLSFLVDAKRAQQVQDLLAQPKKVIKSTGAETPYTNAYHFLSCKADASRPESFRVVCELMRGEWVAGTKAKRFTSTKVDVTTGVQRLFTTYLAPGVFDRLPRALRDGVAQEAAQQAMSNLGLLGTKSDTSFPTREDRNPERRRQLYERAIDHLIEDVRPLNYAKARDLDPGAYKADDKRGDRLVVRDDRWEAMIRNRDPHPFPLYFITADAVQVQIGEREAGAGVSKADRHRRRLDKVSEQVRNSRSEKIKRRGSTMIRNVYALLPILDTSDEGMAAILKERDERRIKNGRPGATPTFTFRAPAVFGKVRKETKKDMRVLLSYDQARFGRILERSDVKIACSRVVQDTKAKDDWYLQLVVHVPYTKPEGLRPVLGVTLGLDAIATWALVSPDGQVLNTGSMAPNPQIATYLARKRALETIQKRQSWMGGRTFDRELEGVTHVITEALVSFAKEQGAILALHDVTYVQKAGADSRLNELHTAWNYGQLTKQVGYKAPIAGVGDPEAVSDYEVRMTCQHCGAIRKPKQSSEKADTWRENGTLHCRKCGMDSHPTPVDDAIFIARTVAWRQVEREGR